jgi:hypothetical protein
MIDMTNTEIEINGKQVPLNRFVTVITSKLVMAIVGSLKGIEENDVKEVNIKIQYD